MISSPFESSISQVYLFRSIFRIYWFGKLLLATYSWICAGTTDAGTASYFRVGTEIHFGPVRIGHFVLRADELRVLHREGHGQPLEMGREELLRDSGQFVHGDRTLAVSGEGRSDTGE